MSCLPWAAVSTRLPTSILPAPPGLTHSVSTSGDTGSGRFRPTHRAICPSAAARIAEGLDLPPEDDPLRVHLLVESARQAGFDRPDVLHENADGRHLIADDRLVPRSEAIRPDRVATLGDSWHEGDTMYMCAVDGGGMAVSLIQSNADGFGSHLTLPGLGVFLHNRGIGFSTDPDHPAWLRAGTKASPHPGPCPCHPSRRAATGRTGNYGRRCPTPGGPPDAGEAAGRRSRPRTRGRWWPLGAVWWIRI